jgi:hypothetical protein
MYQETENANWGQSSISRPYLYPANLPKDLVVQTTGCCVFRMLLCRMDHPNRKDLLRDFPQFKTPPCDKDLILCRLLPSSSIVVTLKAELTIRNWSLLGDLVAPRQSSSGQFDQLVEVSSSCMNGESWQPFYSPHEAHHCIINHFPSREQMRSNILCSMQFVRCLI